MRVFSTKSSFPFLLLLILSLSLFSCQNSSDNIDFDKKITVKELGEDLEFLISTLEKRHVDFYERADRDSVSLMKSKVRSMISKEMNRASFFKVIGLLNPTYRDAHCLVFPLSDEVDYMKTKGIKPFPFSVKLDENGYLKLENSYVRKGDKFVIPNFWKIDSINGISTNEIISKITLYSHGETKVLRAHMSTLLFSDWLFTLYGWRGDFEIVFNNGAKKVKLKNKDVWQIKHKTSVPYNSFNFLKNEIGYLRLGSFDIDEYSEKYYRFIDSSFNAMAEKKISKLIIDVRGNTGGQSDAGAAVLKYLTSRKIPQVSQAYDRINEDNSGIFDFRGEPGELKMVDLSEDDMIIPSEVNIFKGKVIVLFDEMTYSAGIIFVTTVQDNELAITVGRTTGGFANQTGNIESFRLPNSKLIVYVPSRKFVRPNRNSKVHFVEPDIVIKSSNSSNSSDMVLEKSLKLLN